MYEVLEEEVQLYTTSFRLLKEVHLSCTRRTFFPAKFEEEKSINIKKLNLRTIVLV